MNPHKKEESSFWLGVWGPPLSSPSVDFFRLGLQKKELQLCLRVKNTPAFLVPNHLRKSGMDQLRKTKKMQYDK